MTNTHSFHIPIMGIGFTLDTPLKVSQYGIDSVISLVDDTLIEKIRKMYCEKFKLPYNEISVKDEDARANRITSYLNLINKLAKEKFEEFKNATVEKSNEIKKYFSLLPDSSSIKQEFQNLTAKHFNLNEIKDWIKNNVSMGSIDVNIMTKLDTVRYLNNEKRPAEFNDAHAALRGYAKSDLKSSLVLSAGMNPKLYTYLEQFEDFYPDENGEIKKKIVLKVSDYRSALIQGKFLAKKGLWISEFRVESGLNCGGHAFATDGYLMGPILSEFKEKREELVQSLHEILLKGLEDKNHSVPKTILPVKVTAQGGVGTAEEHQFLIDQYELDSVGWCSPFLLVPEVVNVDNYTLEQLRKAEEKDLYLSHISPLGISFNNLRGNTRDVSKQSLIDAEKPGSTCPKRFLVSNNEYTEKTICTSSRQYQRIKIEELDKAELPAEEYKKKFDSIVERSCICSGLGASALLSYGLDTAPFGDGVSVCPGPNLAYFSKIMTLNDMTNHIYGNENMITRTDRPHVFIKELGIYIDFIKDKIEEAKVSMTKKQAKYLSTFMKNLKEGVDYYAKLFSELKNTFEDVKPAVIANLNSSQKTLQVLTVEIESLSEMVRKA